MKTCSRCRRTLPVSEFRSRKRDGRTEVGSYCRDCDLNQRRVVDTRRRDRARNGAPVDREPTPMLDAGPFVAWLHSELERLGTAHDSPLGHIANQVGVHPRRVRTLLAANERLYLDTVDRWLCALDRPELLADLYPDLYVFADRERTAA
jgi:hypothetical protein